MVSVSPAGKDISSIRVVVCGCGAAGFTCAKYFVSLGVQQHNLIAVDVKVSSAAPAWVTALQGVSWCIVLFNCCLVTCRAAFHCSRMVGDTAGPTHFNVLRCIISCDAPASCPPLTAGCDVSCASGLE
jgi:hypothetical protein